jgi:iron(III) transport system permease protein
VATAWLALLGMHHVLYSLSGAAWIAGLTSAPLAALICGLSFAAASRDLEQLTALETGPWGVVRHTILPAARDAIGLAAAATVFFTLWDITVTDVLAVRTFGEEVFTQFQLGAGPWRATAVALPVMLTMAILAMLMLRWLARDGLDAAPDAVPPPVIRLGPFRGAALALVIGLAAACVGLPAFALLKALRSPANLWTAWHTARPELLNTLWLTPLAATVAVVLALPSAWLLARRRRGAGLVTAGQILLLSMPAPVIGIGLIVLLNRPGLPGLLYDTRLTIAAAYVIRALPFAVLVLIPGIRRIPSDCEDAAALDGAGRLQTLRKVVMPLGWRSLAAAWFLSFTLSLSDMGASFLVTPPGATTLSTRFFTLIHYGVYPDAAGICLILLAIAALAAALLAVLWWPALRRRLG